MALVKFGGGVVQMSGSIAGDTFARNRYGNYARARTKPTNPNTTYQVRARNCLSYCTEYWADTLSAANRAAWNLYASNVEMKNRLGETINLSGFNHFIRSNCMRKWYSKPMIAAGPVNFTLPDKDPFFAIDVDENPQNIAITFDTTHDWCTEVTAFMIIRTGHPQNAQRNFYAGPWYPLVIIFSNPAGLASPVNVVPSIPVAVGQKLWCMARIYTTDGRCSQLFPANALVHAQAIGEVPMLIGMLQSDAEALLTSPEVQLTVGIVTSANHETIPVDCVISSDPVAHTRLDAGDPVDLVISLGPSA